VDTRLNSSQDRQSVASCDTVEGIEVAASLVDKAKSVTIVGLVETPFQPGLGRQVGDVIKQVAIHAPVVNQVPD